MSEKQNLKSKELWKNIVESLKITLPLSPNDIKNIHGNDPVYTITP